MTVRNAHAHKTDTTSLTQHLPTLSPPPPIPLPIPPPTSFHPQLPPWTGKKPLSFSHVLSTTTTPPPPPPLSLAATQYIKLSTSLTPRGADKSMADLYEEGGERGEGLSGGAAGPCRHTPPTPLHSTPLHSRTDGGGAGGTRHKKRGGYKQRRVRREREREREREGGRETERVSLCVTVHYCISSLSDFSFTIVSLSLSLPPPPDRAIQSSVCVCVPTPISPSFPPLSSTPPPPLISLAP